MDSLLCHSFVPHNIDTQGFSQDKKYIATQGELQTKNVHLNSKISAVDCSVHRLILKLWTL